MAYVLSTNIVSPLGFTTEDNINALYEGKSSLQSYVGLWHLPETFVASLFSDEQRAEVQRSGYTLFESLCIESAQRALTDTDFDISAPDVLLILSTTKANAPQGLGTTAYRHPGEAAQRIAKALGITTRPIVVCNACISGVNAQILAERMLRTSEYRYAIIIGADVQSDFIVSGFQSLKSVSTRPCRPFDIERNGLNLGECAATIILTTAQPCSWSIESGAIRNDAIHITNPSPQGEGCLQAINAALTPEQRVTLSCINVHGTATMYNDQMESKAMQRAGLGEIPAFGIKGYYGHTMGAAGVLESIITLQAVERGKIPATRGYAERGVSGKIHISGSEQTISGHSFLKVISGFGGCNAAVYYTKQDSDIKPGCNPHVPKFHTARRIKLSSQEGKTLTALYRETSANYPKYYKMDGLSKLAFIAAEMLGADFDAVALFNRTSSIASDLKHAQLIANKSEFYPSPSVFIYTLPNITTGEIAIRHAMHGETSFYILPTKDMQTMLQIITATLIDPGITRLLTGWVDYQDETHWEADMFLAEKE